MTRSASVMWLGTTVIAFVLGYAVGPGRPAAVQNGAGGTQAAPLLRRPQALCRRATTPG